MIEALCIEDYYLDFRLIFIKDNLYKYHFIKLKSGINVYSLINPLFGIEYINLPQKDWDDRYKFYKLAHVEEYPHDSSLGCNWIYNDYLIDEEFIWIHPNDFNKFFDISFNIIDEKIEQLFQ